MDFHDIMIDRNAHFAESGFNPDLKMLPSKGTIIVGCVDPRVDPVHVLGLEQGEAAVIRNVGGRVNAALIETLEILGVVAKSRGRADGVRNIVLLHHTDCGIIGCHNHAPDLLAQHLGVETGELASLAIADPHKAVAIDIAALGRVEQLADDTLVSGIVYDIATGRIETVVPPTPLRAPSS